MRSLLRMRRGQSSSLHAPKLSRDVHSAGSSIGALFCSGRLGYKNTLGMNWTKAAVGPFVTQVFGLCGRMYGCQSDMLGFVAVQLSVRYVGLCGCVAVSPICWALWPYYCQSDMLGFVAV